MKIEKIETFPLSKTKSIRGNRRLAREKVLQILCAYRISESSLDDLFNHIFFREFNFGDDTAKPGKLLTPDEIYELEADIPIHWKKEEIEFGSSLLKTTIEISDYADSLIDKYAKNWQLDRIAVSDRILMQVAISEFINFSEIPLKVSIDEAIDIAKKYSTEKSSVFINGIIDSVLDMLKSEGKIVKSGRGLNEG